MGERESKMRVKDLVVRDVITVSPDDTLREAVTLMAENRVSAMPVVDNRNRCKGILSSTDLVRFFRDLVEGRLDSDRNDAWAQEGEGDPSASSQLVGRRVSEIMTGDVMTVGLEDPVLRAAHEMVRSRVHRLAVVDSNNRVIGILSTLDLLLALSRED